MQNTSEDLVEVTLKRGEARFLLDMLNTKLGYWQDRVRELDTHAGFALSCEGVYGDKVADADFATSAAYHSQVNLYTSLVADFAATFEEKA